ncbi:MAG: hypothetical protein LCH56_14260 [Proteobacteria bacterium]|nr:hypothetical protein [Pseudomonadota bacterium]
MEQRKAWYPNGFSLPPLPEFPPGVGVPGKPITADQFYTEDVFRMLVPDDGLTAVANASIGPERPVQRLSSTTRIPLDWAERYDPQFMRAPAPHPDARMAVHPDNFQNPCELDPKLGGRVRGMEMAIAEHKDNLNQLRTEQDPRKRAAAEESRAINERVIVEGWAQYQRDLAAMDGCKT